MRFKLSVGGGGDSRGLINGSCKAPGDPTPGKRSRFLICVFLGRLLLVRLV